MQTLLLWRDSYLRCVFDDVTCRPGDPLLTFHFSLHRSGASYRSVPYLSPQIQRGQAVFVQWSEVVQVFVSTCSSICSMLWFVLPLRHMLHLRVESASRQEVQPFGLFRRVVEIWGERHNSTNPPTVCDCCLPITPFSVAVYMYLSQCVHSAYGSTLRPPTYWWRTFFS